MAKHELGILILHGFAASLDSVNILEHPLQILNLPVRMPILRGHGAESPTALEGVTWRDWVYDSEAALRALTGDVEKAIVIGHGMGGLLALILAGNCSSQVDSLILAAPSIELPKPLLSNLRLQVLNPNVQRMFPRWSLPPGYTDKKQRKTDTNYRWAPMDAIQSFFELIKMTRSRLSDVKAPVLILQSKRDDTVKESGPQIIRNAISTPAAQKRIHWFQKSQHELFRDCEREQVVEMIVDYVMQRVDGQASSQPISLQPSTTNKDRLTDHAYFS
jgi:carboxylesterase